MTRWARFGVAMITVCAVISPFGMRLRHAKDTPGIDDSHMLKTLVSFNHFFVKYIWFWTWCTVLPFATAYALLVQSHSSYNFKKRSRASVNYFKLLHPFIRVGVFGSIIWAVFNVLKTFLREHTGRCVIKGTSKVILKATTLKACKWYGNLDGGEWTGFNISGHCFMLNFCTLIMLNELEEYVYMKKRINNEPLKLMYWFCAGFIVMCQSMVLITYCFYHEPLEKIAGTILAVVCWQLLYEELFKKRLFLPRLIAPPIKEKSL